MLLCHSYALIVSHRFLDTWLSAKQNVLTLSPIWSSFNVKHFLKAEYIRVSWGLVVLFEYLFCIYTGNVIEGKVVNEYTAVENGELDLIVGETIQILQMVKKILVKVLRLKVQLCEHCEVC